MDASSSLRHSKNRQKVSQRFENEDRISNLPDHLLEYIVSFLPTIYAIRTCVLSTRWKSVWTSIDNFNFCDGVLLSYSEKYFHEITDRVLQHLDAVNISKFRLICMGLDAFLFEKWISNMKMRNVHEVVISITCLSSRNMFSSRLFHWDSLRLLKVEISVFMKVSIHLATSICFPSLKVLHLTGIVFPGDQSTQEVSLNCSVLEELVLDKCIWLKIKNATILAPKLKLLRIEDPRGYGSHTHAVKIYAESLISLKLKFFESFGYFLFNLSSLVDVSIDVLVHDHPIVHCVGSLVRAIYNVQDLQLSAKSIKMLAVPDVSTHLLSLSKLTHLSVASEKFWDGSGKELIDILSNTPSIEHLFFPTGLALFDHKRHGQIIGRTPCFLPNLKLVDIRYFTWKDKEIWFIKFLMRSAKAMDGWTIRLTTDPNCRRKDLVARTDKVTKELKLFARDSNCVIDFA